MDVHPETARKFGRYEGKIELEDGNAEVYRAMDKMFMFKPDGEITISDWPNKRYEDYKLLDRSR